MKIGFYDSGLGGISVLNRFLDQGLQHEYIYFGDSARAPYGDKSKEELIGFLEEILDFMQEQEVDLVVSACNTTSMYLHELDLSKYSFKIVCLFDVMYEYFEQNKGSYALLATAANIDSQRYKEWNADIHPIKCPKLVPLVEAGKLNEAREEFANYLKEVPNDLNKVIVGCTHYSFLTPEQDSHEFIDPADLLFEHVQAKPDYKLGDSAQSDSEHDLKIYSSGDLEQFHSICEKLISTELSLSPVL